MKIFININFFVIPKFQKGKDKIKRRIEKILADLFPNQKIEENTETKYTFEIDFESWQIAVYNVLELSQKLGRSWIITGNIDFQFDLWTNETSIIGVQSIGLWIHNPKYYFNDEENK